jgi:hypothetical protein
VSEATSLWSTWQLCIIQICQCNIQREKSPLKKEMPDTIEKLQLVLITKRDFQRLRKSLDRNHVVTITIRHRSLCQLLDRDHAPF